MRAKGHLETYNHFSLVVRDAALCQETWEKVFRVKIPGMMAPGEEMPEDLMGLFKNTPTYRGGPWPAPKDYGVEQPLLAPFYQPGHRMIEVKAAGSMPSLTEFYEKYGSGIQYFGIVEGDNRNAFIESLQESYGVGKLEEMFYDPMPGDFCVVETEPVLGFNLCVKQDGALNGYIEETIPATAEAAIVVQDLEQAVRNWTDIFDIPMPQIQTIVEEGVVRGVKTQITFRTARIDALPFPLYLVESGPVSPFAEFAEKPGFGIHHITFDIQEDPEAFRSRMEQELHFAVLAEYDLEGYRYIIFDTISVMGALIAIRVYK